MEKKQPITGDTIAEHLNLTRATLRPDLTILTMCGILDAKPKVGYFISSKKTDFNFFEKLSSITVNDIKSVPIVVSEETSVYDTIVTLFLENVGTIFVVNEDDLKGVISRKDLLKAAMGGGNLNNMPVGVIMTRVQKIIYCSPKEDIVEAAEKIIDNDVDCIPIVEKENHKLKVIGRISKTNITRAVIEIAKEL